MNFSLPEWEPKRDFAPYESLTESLMQMSRKTGFQSKAFLKSCNAIFTKAKQGKVSEIPGLIRKPLDVRALTTLWLSELFFEMCPVTQELINALYHPRPFLSKLVIQQLLRLFFQRFEQAGDLNALLHCLHQELGRSAKQLKSSSLGKLIKHKTKIINVEGPSWVAKTAISKKTDLDIFIESIGLKSFAESRFYSLCQNHYYLEQLRKLEPWHPDPLLQEIIKPSVYESPYNQTEMLGHEILRILIDRSPKEKVDEQWQGIILTIAGDPRMSKSSPRYQRWWTALSTQQIQKVRGWLSRFDLLLFLKVLEDYADMNGKEDMNRMFPARKKFLEGLFDLGLVEDSRLFINKNAEYYLKKNYKKDELPYYSIVADPNRSMIYLKVKGKHMIEGTHNFKLWIYEDLPPDSQIFNLEEKYFAPKELTTKLESNFYKYFNGLSIKSPVSITHNGDWQYKAIDAFESFGVRINPEKVLTEKMYLQYKRKVGLQSNFRML